MNVAFFAQKLPITIAEEIRKQLDNALPAVSSKEDYSLQQLLIAPDVLELLYTTLREMEMLTLRLIVTAFGCEPFDDAKLGRSGRSQLSGAAIKVGLMRLCRKGIVFALRKSWGEQLYMLPADTMAIWSKLLFPVNHQQLHSTKEETITTSSIEGPLPSARILTALAYCFREGLPLTQKGTIAKRHVMKLTAKLRLLDNEARVPAIRYVGEDTYPFTFAAIVDMCLRFGLLKAQAHSYMLNEDKLNIWLEQSEEEMNQSIYASLFQLLVPVEPSMRHWIVRSEEQAPRCWFSIKQLITELEQRMIIQSGSLHIDGIISHWLQPLESLGFIEMGYSLDGERTARWTTPAARTEAHQAAVEHSLKNEPIFVQPDFEIIVPPGVSYKARWELEQFAEQEQAGGISRYRLTRECTIQALEAGYAAERILSTLRKHAKYGVPELVEYSLTQWAGQYGRAAVEDAVIFRCRDEDTAREMQQNVKLKPFLLEQIGPLVWLVEPSSAQALFGQLEACGYSPSRLSLGFDADKGKSDSRASSASDPVSGRQQTLATRTIKQTESRIGDDDPQGLIYSRVSVQYYDIERTFPRLEDLYPGLQDVPNIWLKECRSYHAATRMDMIRKAVEWKACVRLRQEGQDRLLVPERLEGTSERWIVSGYNPTGEVKLSPEQWEEMQLVLPGINDEG